MLAPLAALGASDDDETVPTHFFARQNEDKLTHKLAAFVGRLGFDVPLRYDVMYTNLPVSRRGQVATQESDHDLMWTAVQA